MRTTSIRTASPGETLDLADRLGRLLRGGEVLALMGDLGAGKTVFVKGVCRGLGLLDISRVSSPSYVLEHIYETRLRVHHYDAYRLESADEFLALGFEEHLGSESDVMIVEWADRVAEALPPERLSVEITCSGPASGAAGAATEEGRNFRLSGLEGIWGAILGRLKGA